MQPKHQPIRIEYFEATQILDFSASPISLQQRGITVLDWPPFPPDLNPIENVGTRLSISSGVSFTESLIPEWKAY
jgi:hypothetical protein